MRTVPVALAFAGILLTSADAFAASELSRTQSTTTTGRNAITFDRDIKFAGYVSGERLAVVVEYSATCNVVFRGLSLFRPIPFAPPRVVTGEFGNVRGTPTPGRAAPTGAVTFDLRFDTLNTSADGAQSGLARFDLVLGVDTDCDLATGDTDGVDRASTMRIQIRVTSGSDGDD